MIALKLRGRDGFVPHLIRIGAIVARHRRHMRKFAIVAALAALTLAPAAQAMTVAEFLAKAHKLQAKGILAPFYDDFKILKAEIRGITRSYRAEIAAAKAAARPPHSCPPPKGTPAAKIKPEALLGELDKIPPSQRGMSMKTAFYVFMQNRFPCR